ncbi:permease [Chloroflexota bacterium]
MAMKIKEAVKKLDTTLLILMGLVIIVIAAVFWRGGVQLLLSGFTQAGHLLNTIWLRLILGFTLGGLMQVLVPRDIIAKWLGPASGLKGILIGSYTGTILSGAPYVMLPIIAAIYRAGAGVGPIIALLTGQGLIGIQMLIVWQIPFFGVELPLARYIVSFFIPPFAGLAGAAIFRLMGKLSRFAGDADDIADSEWQQGEITDVTEETSGKEKGA